MNDRVRQAESRLTATAEKLKRLVTDKAGDATTADVRRRKSYVEIFEATVPDPLDIGLALE
jgi:type IV secretion system protein VirD4